MTRGRGALVPAFLLVASSGLAQTSNTVNSFDQSDPFASRFKEKSRFEIHFQKPARGGNVKITAQQENCREQLTQCEAEGDVVVEYGDVTIRADRLTFDRKANVVNAQGHVVIDQGKTRMSGASAVFDLEKKTGSLEDAQADLDPEFHIVAKRISKVGETTYEIEDGIFTACSLPTPAWSFRTRHARITLDDYARLRNTSFRIRNFPVLFTPYLIWPTKEDRASGFLVPGVGYNSRRGGYLGLTYYWVTGRSTDSTTSLDLYTKKAIGLGEEFRWAPSPESAGVFQGFILRDPNTDVCIPGFSSNPNTACTLAGGSAGINVPRERTRWKLRLDHASDDLPWDLRAVVSILDYSDPNYLADFERTYNLAAARTVSSSAFVTKNTGDDSVNLRLERTESQFNQVVLLERTPSLEFTHRVARIPHTPLYAALDASFSRLFVDRGPDLPHGGYNRGDVHPALSLPLKGIPWLSVTAKGGARWTGYSDSTTSYGASGQSFTGSSTTRTIWTGGASSVGPSFSRIYDVQIGPFARWKHVMEPRLDYDYVRDAQEPDRIPQFDEIDSILGKSTLRYALVNRLLAKPGGENPPPAQEVASLELSQTYNFRPQQTIGTVAAGSPLLEARGPAQAVLRLTPGPKWSVDGSLSYDTNVSKLTRYSLTAGARWHEESASISWDAQRPILPAGLVLTSANTDFLRATASVRLFSKSWHLDTQWVYDARAGQTKDTRSLLTYKGSCYTLLLEVHHSLLGTQKRTDYRLVINLKDIGTLLDVNGGLDKMF